MPVSGQPAAFAAGPPLRPDRPVVLVHGNCLAESLRVLLDAGDVLTVRMPPVHELARADLAPLGRWLAACDLLVTQPVRDGYRDLPIGTRQLAAAMAPSAQVVRFPVIRCAGLYPTHAIIRPPSDPSLVPPVVAYHDLRTLAEAAGSARPGPPTPDAVRAIAAASLDELRLREARHDTVVVSDLLARPTFELMRTLNHPGNELLLALAGRVRVRARLPAAPVDPGRPLLNAVHAPRAAAVIEAFALSEAPRPDWIVDGAPVSAGAVREAHLRWYAARPDAVAAGLARHAATLALLPPGREWRIRSQPTAWPRP